MIIGSAIGKPSVEQSLQQVGPVDDDLDTSDPCGENNQELSDLAYHKSGRQALMKRRKAA